MKNKGVAPPSVPFAMRDFVEKDLQEEGTLELAEWAAPSVVVFKDRSSVRICGDFRVTVNPASDTGLLLALSLFL